MGRLLMEDRMSEMTPISIEAARADQAEAILAVIVAAFKQYEPVLDPPSSVVRETAEDVRRKLAQGGGFVARDGSNPVGATLVGAVLYEVRPDYVYMGRLSVLPAYRGQRIAHRLCAAVEQAARAQGHTRIQLAVRLPLTGNQRFFGSLGYQVIGTHSHESYTEPTFFTMEKVLPKA